MEKLKIALIGASHWHVPLYLNAFETENLNLAAVSDQNIEFSRGIADQFHCRSYLDWFELLDEEKPDFVFAFAQHSEMPTLAKELISRGIPFSIEKPLGTCANDVRDVREFAYKKGVFCSIPFIWRYSNLLVDLRRKVSAQDFTNFSFIFVAGPPNRYLNSSPWMLKAATAGSGCMTNLGIHFIDMALLLSGSEGGEALASAFHYMNGYDVEDYATTLVSLSSGATMSIQTGYAFPMDDKGKRDNRWNFTTKSGYFIIGDDRLESRQYGKQTTIESHDTDTDGYYAIYTIETIKQYVEGKNPSAGLDDMLRARVLLDNIIEKARSAS
jgi:predicted dehydrogenase